MLVTIEGIDGSGKSTLIDSIKEILIKNDMHNISSKCIFTKEPYGVMKDSFNKFKGNTKKEALFYLLSHSDHIERLIEPKKNKIIISERFFDSFIAFQSETLKYDINKMIKYQNKISVIPDLTVILYCNPEIAISRGEQMIDSIAFVNTVQENYKIIESQNRNIISFDTSNISLNDYNEIAKKVVDNIISLQH